MKKLVILLSMVMLFMTGCSITKLDNTEINKNMNYIKYISNNKIYITYNFPSVSQLMRILIAEELNYKDKFDWKKERFDENIISTIERIKGELK